MYWQGVCLVGIRNPLFILLDTKRAKTRFVIQNFYTISKNWKIFVIHFLLNKSLVNKKWTSVAGVWVHPLHPPPYWPAMGLQGDKGFQRVWQGVMVGVVNGKIRDAETLVRNPSPRLLDKKFRDSKKVKTNHAKTRLTKNASEISRFC